jgi:hypothetical protein
MTVIAALNQNNLGPRVTTRDYSYAELVRRQWGSEFNAPDKGSYVWSNGRAFDSTDMGQTGLYNPNANAGFLLDGGNYPDMAAYLLTEDPYQLDQN